MRLATFDDGRVGVVRGDEIVDVTDLVDPAPGHGGRSVMRTLIGRWETVRATITDLDGRTAVPLSSVRLRAPVPDPTKIVAAPVNYVDHMNEMSETAHVSSLGVFLKAPSSLLDPGGVIRLPYHDRRFDQEGELAFVIGRTARNVSVEDALDYVFGYTGLLDITMRGGEDRSVRKSFDTFTPLGPWLVTPDEAGAPDDVELACSVSGRLRQKANTSELIWGVARLLAYASSVMTLEAGDVVTTGTPAGVGPVEDGDTVELSLSGIGVLRVGVCASGATACPTNGRGAGPVPPPPPPR